MNVMKDMFWLETPKSPAEVHNGHLQPLSVKVISTLLMALVKVEPPWNLESPPSQRQHLEICILFIQFMQFTGMQAHSTVFLKCDPRWMFSEPTNMCIFRSMFSTRPPFCFFFFFKF